MADKIVVSKRLTLAVGLLVVVVSLVVLYFCWYFPKRRYAMLRKTQAQPKRMILVPGMGLHAPERFRRSQRGRV